MQPVGFRRVRRIPAPSLNTLTAFLIAAVVFCLLRMARDDVAIFNSEGFIERSRRSLLDLAFWVGPRPFTTDLFFKLAGSDPTRAVLLQQLLHAASWATLGYAVATGLENRRVALTIQLAFLAIAVWWNIAGWTWVMRSESCAFSLFALWQAALIVFLRTPTKTRLTLLLLVSVLFSNTRDNHPVFLLTVAAGTLLVAVLLRDPRRRRLLTAHLIFVVLIAGAQATSANEAQRHRFSLINNIMTRVATHPERHAWFRERGMPWATSLDRFKNKGAGFDDWALWKESTYAANPVIGDFAQWTIEDGKYTYAQYLLTHPGYALSPLTHRRPLYSANLYEYTGNPPEVFPFSLAADLGMNRLLMLAFVLLIAVGVARNRYARDSWRYFTAAALCFAILVQLLFVYHADALEVARHSLIIGIQSWALALIVGAWLVDGHLARKYARRGTRE